MASKPENDVEARADTLDRISDFRSTLIDFAKRVAATADEFDPVTWNLDLEKDLSYEEVDDFHQALQSEMTSLETDFEDLKTCVFDLESELSAWSDMEEELDNKDEAEMEFADKNYRRDA